MPLNNDKPFFVAIACSGRVLTCNSGIENIGMRIIA